MATRREPMRERCGAPAEGWVAQGWVALRLAGMAQDVILPDCREVHAGLAAVLRGWPGQTRPVPEEGPEGPKGRSGLLTEPGRPGRYLVASPYLDDPMRHLPLASALCALLADLSQALVDETPGLRALHCGAFRAGDGLVAVTGAHRAGKSTLIARLTAEAGVEVFCDDVLPITAEGEGIALGIAPRLRLPLPQGTSRRFADHVAAHSGPRDDRYAYLCAPGLAPHGARAALRTMIVLDRRPEATAARLHHVDPGEAFQHLVARNLGLFQAAEDAVASLEDLLAGLVCLRLVYSNLEEAVALLRRAFALGALPDPAVPIAPAEPDAPRPVEDLPEPCAPDQAWARAEGVALRRIGGDAVLWRPGEAMVWQLNPVAHATWEILGEGPATAEEIGAVLVEVFAGEAAPRLAGDIGRLLAGLAREGLVEAVRGEGAGGDD